jgi:hypothetical protein
MDDLEKEELEALRELERWVLATGRPRRDGAPRSILEKLDTIRVRRAWAERNQAKAKR